MSEKLYYNDYYKQYGVQYIKGRYNIVALPCGSGKTFHCLEFITEKREHTRRGKDANMSRCLYVTDTSALKESVICAYERHTGRKVESTRNIEVITYSKLAYLLYRENDKQFKDGVASFARDYDYIFLDEIHQLFLYSDRYDKDDDDVAEYQDVVDSLPIMVDYTTLICLSATPKPLEQYLNEIDEVYKIHRCIPIVDLPKIKAYNTTYTIPIYDTKSHIESNIRLKPQDKLFIFAITIRELRELEEVCQAKGYTTLALWSIKYNNMKSDDEEEEERLASRRMTPYQLEARERLLTTGEYREQVILLNGAYESGINIENGADSEQRTIYVVVSSSDEYAITQARGRIRHDIDALYHLSYNYCKSEVKGIENNQALMERLDKLVELCEENEAHFMGKEGLNQIANTLNIWYQRIDSKGKNQGRIMAKSIDNINNRLILMELPYRVERVSEVHKEQGKTKRMSYYIVVRAEH